MSVDGRNINNKYVENDFFLISLLHDLDHYVKSVDYIDGLNVRARYVDLIVFFSR